MSGLVRFVLLLSLILGLGATDGKASAVRDERAATGRAQPGPATKNVLLLFSGRFNAPLSIAVDEAVRATFQRSRSVKVELYAETLDVARFDPERYGPLVAAYLREKFAEHKLDLIVTSLPQAPRFLLKFRKELFPDTPIVYCLADESELAALTPAPNVTGVPLSIPWKETLDLALGVHPDTRHVVVITGTDGLARIYLRQTQRVFRPYENRLVFTYLTDRTLPQLLKEVASLPPNTIIIYTTFAMDGAGQVYIDAEVSGMVAKAANAPVYGINMTFLGRGITGGHIIDNGAHATRATEIGLRILAGEKPEAIAVSDVPTPPRFDARQLKRWKIAESRLPAGSIVLYKDPSFWGQYRLLILIVIVCLLEGALIVILLVQLRRRKLAEESLRKTEEKYRNIFEGAVEGIFETSPQAQPMSVNPALARILGYDSPDELISVIQDSSQLYADIDKRAELVGLLEEQGVVLGFECEFLRRDGAKIWVSINVRRVCGPDGQTLSYSGFIEDITDRKKTEETLKKSEIKYRKLHESMMDGFVSVSMDGMIKEFNESYRKMTGYAPEELLKLTYRDLTPEKWHRFEQKIVEQQILARGYSDVYEKEYRRKDGTIFPVELRTFLIKDETGSNVGMWGIVRDITERKRGAETLQKSEEQAKQLAQENSIMAEIGRIISSTLNIEEVYKFFAEKVRELIPFDRIAIGLINSEQNTITFPYIEGLCVPGREPGDIIPLVGSTAEKMLQTHAGMIIAMESEEEIGAWVPGLLPEFRCGIRSALTVPLISGDRVIGTLALRSTLPGIYTEQDLKLVQSIGNQIAGAIANAQLYGRLKETEESLWKSEGKFRDLFDNAPVGYHELDMEGRITNVNRTDQEMLGYSREELIGEYIWKFNAEEDIAHRMILEKLAGLRPPGHSFERTYRRKDGTTVPVLLQDRLNKDDQGRITGIRVAVQDITERKRAEEALNVSETRYRRLFESAKDGILILDAETGKVVDVNPFLIETLGSSQEEFLGRELWELGFFEDIVKNKANFLELKQKGYIRYEDLPLRTADGRQINVEFVSNAYEVDDQKVIQCNIRDITERKRAEEEKADLQEQLRQSQKLEGIGRLAGGIAHDFNNLLTVIRGYSQLSLSELQKRDPLRENIEEIQQAGDRAADLTRQLLAFSRRQILEFKTLDLNQLTQGMEKMLRRMIGEDIELMIYPGEDLGSIRTDPGQMEQVIMNLAVNARDAMPSGGKVILETENVYLDEEYARNHISVKPGPYVRLSITDTGCGMTPEVREQVFEPFFTTKEKGKGTGLGLSTVYGIVKQSDGNIWVYSEPGKGTTFKIYLPRIDEPVDVMTKKGKLKEIPRGNETVLVVEDEEIVRKLAVQILKNRGYKVLEAALGGEALLVLERHPGPVHLILTDVVMPGMSGPELVARLRHVRKDFKVLYMSGYTDESVIYHGVRDGEMNFIQKPFTLEILGRKVREVLDEVSEDGSGQISLF